MFTQSSPSRYNVIRTISQEQTTDVCAAVDIQTDEAVVIKFPKRGCRQTANEVKIMPKIQHRHILPLRDVVYTRFGPAPVYPYAPGGDLLALIEAVSFGEEKVKEIMFQLLSALSYLHRRLIVHGDIRPENIVFLEDGTLKIIDFGLARELPAGNSAREAADSSTYYSAPELLIGHGKSCKSDVWAVGITMFAC